MAALQARMVDWPHPATQLASLAIPADQNTRKLGDADKLNFYTLNVVAGAGEVYNLCGFSGTTH